MHPPKPVSPVLATIAAEAGIELKQRANGFPCFMEKTHILAQNLMLAAAQPDKSPAVLNAVSSAHGKIGDAPFNDLGGYTREKADLLFKASFTFGAELNVETLEHLSRFASGLHNALKPRPVSAARPSFA